MAEKLEENIVQSAFERGWVLLAVDSFGVNVEHKTDPSKGIRRTMWQTFKVPDGVQLVVAKEIYQGAGEQPQPAGTITEQEYIDLVRGCRLMLEDALIEKDDEESTTGEW